MELCCYNQVRLDYVSEFYINGSVCGDCIVSSVGGCEVSISPCKLSEILDLPMIGSDVAIVIRLESSKKAWREMTGREFGLDVSCLKNVLRS